jgi:hypothetical protein
MISESLSDRTFYIVAVLSIAEMIIIGLCAYKNGKKIAANFFGNFYGDF